MNEKKNDKDGDDMTRGNDSCNMSDALQMVKV